MPLARAEIVFRMTTRFTLVRRGRYPWLFLAFAVVVFAPLYSLLPWTRAVEVSVPAGGIVAGFVYFLYAQHLQETRLFAELFRQFNERYDRLNDSLNQIVVRGDDAMFSVEEKQVLFDYFNLCAEEYLYYKAGYIDAAAWGAWARGMHEFVRVVRIRRLWEAELAGGSYYGFALSLVDDVA